MEPNTSTIDSFQLIFNNTCSRSFGKTPYAWQTEVGGSFLLSHYTNVPVKQLLVRPTGGGKTLVFNGISACLKGVTLCISPLLSLGADQTRKVMKLAMNDDSISAFHIDEMNDLSINHVLRSLKELSPLKTVFLFTSPQCIVRRHCGFFQSILRLSLIRFVVVDEIHLVNHFGRTFRDEFGLLRAAFFQKLPVNTPMLFMTATCSREIITSIETLFGISITTRHWPPPSEMATRNVSFFAHYSSQPLRQVKKRLREILSPHNEDINPLPHKAIVYSNSRRRILKFAESLEEYFDSDDELHKYDVMTLVGPQPRDEKAQVTKMFIDDRQRINQNLDILCATSGVGNAGIDSAEVRSVSRIDFPPKVTDICQEKGRAGRNNTATSEFYSYDLFYSLESFILAFERIMKNPQTDDTVVDTEYQKQEIKELMQSAKLLLESRTCVNITFELMLGNPDSNEDQHLEPCGDCQVCLNTCTFQSINKEKTTALLLDLFVVGENRMECTSTVKNVIKSLCTYPDVNMLLFSSKSKRVQPVRIKKLLFSLIASKQMCIKFDTTNKETVMYLGLSENNVSLLAIQDDVYWNSVSLR